MTRVVLTSAEQDLLAAIERIAVGKPRQKDNRALLVVGRLELTPTNVAREASRSRQSIYRSARVRSILEVKRRAHSPTGNSMRDILNEVRSEMRSIAEENQMLISNLARAEMVALDLIQENHELQTRLKRRGIRIEEAKSRIRLLEAEVAELELDLLESRQLRNAN